MEHHLPTLLLVGLMMVVSALTSAAETAFLSVSKAALNHIARGGNARAAVALALVSNPEPMLITGLLINTLVNIASSALITALLVDTFGDVGVAYATVAMSALILVFCEALPKTLGTRFAHPIAVAFAPTFMLLIRIATPAVWVVKGINKLVLYLMGLKSAKQGEFTENDIRGAINLGLEHGAIRRSQHRMLDAVLDLDDLTVADVMIHRSAIASIDVGTPPNDIPAVLGGLKHSRVAVYEKQTDNIVGFLYVRDYLAALAQVSNRSQVKLRNHVRPTYFVPETTPVGHQLLEFLKQHCHLALVVDEYGDLQGLITLEDILEEIVGEIADEHDRPAEGDEQHADGSVVLPGRHAVRDANRRYNWNLPDDNAVTLAGLMVDQLRHLPAQGEAVTIGNLVLTAVNKRGHRIEKVRLAPLHLPREDPKPKGKGK